MSRDLGFKGNAEIIKAEVFKVRIRNTEHVFDDIKDAESFMLGYSHGLDQKSSLLMAKPYKHGYQEAVNVLARESK